MVIRPSHLIGTGLLATAFLCGLLEGMALGQPPQKAPATSAAVSSSRPSSQVGKPQRDDSYVIGGDDVLAINVWNEAQFKQSVPVRPDGKISLPLIGEVTAAGRTPVQLEDDIAAKLGAYITNPDVTVIVEQINSHKFNILGRVTRPGSYPLSATTTVLDAIALAAGFQDFAKQKDIYILRATPGGSDVRLPFNYKDVIRGKHPEQNIKLQPRDTVIVP